MNLHLDLVLDRRGLATLPRLFQVAANEPAHRALGKRLLWALLAVALLGGGAALVAMARGHHVMGTTSEVPWGILIATYVFLVVSSTGLGLVSSLGHVFGFKLFEPIATRAMFLSLVTLVVGFSVIATELERPILLAKLALLSPNPASPIWWMGTLYGVYLVIIAAELYFLLIGDHRKSRIGGLVTVVAALSIHPTSNLGAVFGLSHARPYWNGPLLPIAFIASALVCGAALLILVVYFGDYFKKDKQLREGNAPLLEALGKLLALFIGITVLIGTWRIITGLNGGHYHLKEVTLALLTGPLFFSFWFFEVFVGTALPLTVLLGRKARSPRHLALAAGLTLLGVFVSRLNFVYAGQMFSLKPVAGRLGESMEYAPPFKGNVAGFLPYTPSLVEALVVAGALAAAVLLFVGGSKALKLVKENSHG
ncbi:MAG: NrfD/PsrC family molybdoenzyme membrane anchor subunit [Myxococcaceae bacterium]